MTEAIISPTRGSRLRAVLHSRNRLLWVSVALVLAGLLYLSTFQTHINGSDHPFTTDVGEIQNALPRWGIIHHSSYPLYSATGSLFVTVLRLVGIPPAAGASLLSLAWGLITIALLVVFTMELGATGPWAALGALAAAVSVSVWMDSSLAELHTMTTALTMATLLFALRFGRSGARSDLLWLVFFFSQGVFHQRSIILMTPPVLLLIWPHLLTPFHMGRRALLLVVGVALLAPLTYLYLPLRVWTGADWVFGSPGTWDGFWKLFFDNRAARVFELDADWGLRLRTARDILNDDLWLPLLAVGLLGLWLVPEKPAISQSVSGGLNQPSVVERQEFLGRWVTLRIKLALTTVWALNLLLTLLIWEDRVSDAQLAAKLPVLLMAGVGLGLLLEWLWRRRPVAGAAAAVMLGLLLVYWAWANRPFVLSITRDNSRQAIVETLERVQPALDGRPIVVQTPWGADYWALTYEQAYGGRLSGLNLVDHNARPQDVMLRGDRLVVPDQTFHIFPPDYYEERLGPLYLSSAAPGVIEIGNVPLYDEATLAADPGIVPMDFDLENGARIRGTAVEWLGDHAILLTIYWEADRAIEADYSIAVHLVAHDPPTGPDDVLNQADHAHPVDGWYPTTRWRPGEIVRDSYLLEVPEGSHPAAIRIAMYRNDPTAGFVNTPWLSLPIPQR
ncbi:MAG TPA: hypothetical protein PLC06_13315 [Promineifilum sp.]|nr:hypothetical protein [Promineifilum sp.]